MRRISGIAAIVITIVVLAVSVLINFPYSREFIIESDPGFVFGFVIGTFIIVLVIVWVIDRLIPQQKKENKKSP
jgi:hypothetical protein